MDQDSRALDIPFAVPFTHRLRFTDDVWGTDQVVLADLLQPSGDQPARVQFWIDQCLADARPDLPARIRAFHPALLATGPLFEGLEEFRQHLGGRLTLTMLRGVGQPCEVHDVDYRQMREALARVVEFAQGRVPSDRVANSLVV